MSLFKEHIPYTEEEKAELFVHAVRANDVCQQSRKDFNLCNSRTTVALSPEVCISEARAVVDCFQRV